jgi:hypothetical protein
MMRLPQLAAAMLLSVVALAQVDLRPDAVVFSGSATNTTAPAFIDEARVRRATAEWQTIEAEGVRRGSARYMLLMSDMDRRIRNAVHKAAADASKDLVVRQGDVSDRKGRPVVDLTDEVIARL